MRAGEEARQGAIKKNHRYSQREKGLTSLGYLLWISILLLLKYFLDPGYHHCHIL